MKITSGSYKGKSLIIPKTNIKPTTEMIRQAIINILRPILAGARMMDLYCGSGSVGIEALSNHAGYVYFVENNFRTYKALKDNLDTIVTDQDRYRTVKHNALEILPILEETGEEPFDIVFADPFYKDTRRQIERLHELVFSVLEPKGTFILEHGDHQDFSDFNGFVESRRYGDTYLTRFIKPEVNES